MNYRETVIQKCKFTRDAGLKIRAMSHIPKNTELSFCFNSNAFGFTTLYHNSVLFYFCGSSFDDAVFHKMDELLVKVTLKGLLQYCLYFYVLNITLQFQFIDSVFLFLYRNNSTILNRLLRELSELWKRFFKLSRQGSSTKSSVKVLKGILKYISKKYHQLEGLQKWKRLKNPDLEHFSKTHIINSTYKVIVH